MSHSSPSALGCSVSRKLTTEGTEIFYRLFQCIPWLISTLFNRGRGSLELK